MKRTTSKSAPAQSPAAPRNTVNCPARPEDYRVFSAAARLKGLEIREAFSQASKLWLRSNAPEFLGGKEAA